MTRPASQNKQLCALLEQIGCHPLALPTLVITPLAGPELNDFTAVLAQQPPPDWLIFVSANAVCHGWPFIDAQPTIVATTRLAAIGQATADALQQRGVAVSAIPEQQFDSDGLLALPAFAAPLKKRIVIIRGRGGREYLAEALRQRGANVEYGECYSRDLPTAGATQLDQWLGDGAIDLVTVTSRAALRNLFALANQDHHESLKKLSYALLSPGLTATAKTLGVIGELLVATEASDAGICAAIEQLTKDID